MSQETLFKRIMVPVDLTHRDNLGKTFKVAGDLAKTHGASITYVGVTSTVPSSVANSVEQYTSKLEALAAEEGKAHGVETSAHAIPTTDPTANVNRLLLKAVDDTGADLVVMQSHIPNVVDYIWASHGGHIAEHANTSVLIVR
ncbi:universal stress protein [Allosediminivita pacifica]|uniref:Nucleotide-binding universal stress UspA family protein n=1 Tax=Allosediminivita pacifica TaxID=1267769 RepID=A0A2T6ARP7_9RHOB|nr:universal stress protein [Allosediminivita pacifica]PTX46494.1 nucleotide-binding universal stress UspA family protein [Allosediminivita pacifica]GGB16729.1 hypothetical protein GCM10011324_28730 [Allosediminivita pacifica]